MGEGVGGRGSVCALLVTLLYFIDSYSCLKISSRLTKNLRGARRIFSGMSCAGE